MRGREGVEGRPVPRGDGYASPQGRKKDVLSLNPEYSMSSYCRARRGAQKCVAAVGREI